MTVDLVGATIGNHDKTTIAGVEVNLSGVTTTTTLISTINNAMSGVNDVVASYDQSNGNLILSSASGATIDLDDLMMVLDKVICLKLQHLWMEQVLVSLLVQVLVLTLQEVQFL